MASLWSKFKISYEERKEKKLFKVAEQELKNMNVDKNVKQLVLKHAEDLLIQNLDDNEDGEDNRTDEDESENEVSLMSKFKLSYKEGKKVKGYVKELEKLLEYKMSHEDVKAYARLALNINPGTNSEENERVIVQVVDILTQDLTDLTDKEEDKDKDEENKEDYKENDSLLQGLKVQGLKEQYQDFFENLRTVEIEDEDEHEDEDDDEEGIDFDNCFFTFVGCMLSSLL